VARSSESPNARRWAAIWAERARGVGDRAAQRAGLLGERAHGLAGADDQLLEGVLVEHQLVPELGGLVERRGRSSTGTC